MNINDELSRKLELRKQDGSLRQLRSSKSTIDFFSNDYLGLARNKGLSFLIREQYDQLDEVSNGATGSRLLSGNFAVTEEIEEQLANLFEGEAALVFNSGYVANQAVLSSVMTKDDTIIYDDKIHVCLKEGARLSNARYFSFKHNNLDDLKSKLKHGHGNMLVAIESVYSMDGDEAPLEDIFDLCEQYNAQVLVDEAHSTGVYGHNGNGLLCEKGLANRAFARIYTFGKAMGVHGACVVGSDLLKQYLVNFARPFIYTTALPPHSLVSISSAFNFLASHHELQVQLAQRISFFKKAYESAQFDEQIIKRVDSDSAIQALIIPGNEQVSQLAEALNDLGFGIRPILSPTVKKGEERLRVCLHIYNSQQEIERLLVLIRKLTHE